jgi:hypothetical protein
MKERLIEPVVLEHVGMTGRITQYTTLYHYDETTDTYHDMVGRTVTGRELADIRAGKVSWLRVGS